MTEKEVTTIENVPTINSQLRKLASEDPDKPAFIIWDMNLKRTVVTRQEIWDKSRKCAAFLHRQGVCKGDIVCNTLLNSQERLITTYGTLLAGAACMNGQKFLADGEDIMKNWKESECKVVIVNPNEENGLYSILEKIKSKDEETGQYVYKGLPHLTHVLYVVCGNRGEGKETWIQDLDTQSDTYVDETVTEEDVAFIFTTSGSTGFAKLVPHTHERILAAGYQLQSHIYIKENSMHFNHRSLGWIGGAPFVYPQVGMTRVFIDYASGYPDDVAEMVICIFEYEKCDTAYLLPTFIQSLIAALNARGQQALSKLLRRIGTGGGPVSKRTMEAIGRISECIVAIYGATEHGYTHSLKATDSSSYENCCTGHPAETIEMKILDDNKEKVVNGQSGIIYLRGKTIAREYLKTPELSKDIFLSDGWYCTSDIGQINDKGQLFVFCRTSNAINYRGYKHYPGWMEARVNNHPDIEKSIAIGIPDPITHEQLCLCLIKSPQANITADEVQAYWKSLFLTSEKDWITPVPKYCLFFDCFPTNSNGKIDRKAIRGVVLKRLEDGSC